MTSSSPRVVVFGYSEVGYDCLRLLIDRGANVVGLVTHEDDPGEVHWFRSVAGLASDHGINVSTPASLKSGGWLSRIRDELRPDIIFSVYYRHLIPTSILHLAPLGAFNMHGSYLPTYRGKAPVNWALLHGADHIGASLHHMVAKPDAGDIVDQERVPIGPDDTAREVMARVTEAATLVLGRQLQALLAGGAPRFPQDHSKASYFGGRTADDGRIDWSKPSAEIYNLIRAVTKPYPGAFADFDDGRRLRVWAARKRDGDAVPGEIFKQVPLQVGTGEGILEITESEWEQTPASFSGSINI